MKKKHKVEKTLACKIGMIKQALVDFIPILLQILLKGAFVANCMQYCDESNKQNHFKGIN